MATDGPAERISLFSAGRRESSSSITSPIASVAWLILPALTQSRLSHYWSRRKIRPGKSLRVLSWELSLLRHTLESNPIMKTNDKPRFLLLFRHPQDEPDPTPEEMERIFGRWMEWMKAMKTQGSFAGADRLEDGGKVLRGSRGSRLTDGPYAEAKEVVGGYVIVSAAGMDEAVALAKGCPGLDHPRFAVEVRPIEQLPPI
jgi:hypothetical protein